MCQPVFDYIRGRGSTSADDPDSLIYSPSEREKEDSRFLLRCHKSAGPAACIAGLFGILLVAETCPDLALGTRFPGMVIAALMGGIAALVFLLRELLRRTVTGKNKQAGNGREKDDS